MVGVSTLISGTRAAEQFSVALGAGMNVKFATVVSWVQTKFLHFLSGQLIGFFYI